MLGVLEVLEEARKCRRPELVVCPFIGPDKDRRIGLRLPFMVRLPFILILLMLGVLLVPEPLRVLVGVHACLPYPLVFAFTPLLVLSDKLEEKEWPLVWLV